MSSGIIKNRIVKNIFVRRNIHRYSYQIKIKEIVESKNKDLRKRYRLEFFENKESFY